MDALLNAALVGTARGGGGSIAPGSPADALAGNLPDLGAERRLLLMAGSRAVYRQTGGGTRTGIVAPAPAPAERLPTCSPGATRLIGAMLAGAQADLLPEALDRLAHAGRRLPPSLILEALTAGERNSSLRPALAAVLGERGHWLARQNRAWRWAEQPFANLDTVVPIDAETIWLEGNATQRLAILHLARAEDPVRGRDWLTATWKQEKAEFRAKALPLLATGLSPADEPFLEAALDDRSSGVRAQAIDLLARLPDSAFSQRLRARAESLLEYQAGADAPRGLRGFVAAVTGQERKGKRLIITLPERIDAAWQREVIAPEASQAGVLALGERAGWLVQLLALIPPGHWEDRFAARPGDLVQAVAEGEWAEAVIEGWSRAALRFRDSDWADSLWGYWSQYAGKALDQRFLVNRLTELVPLLPQREAEQILTQMLGKHGKGTHCTELLAALPRPWSPAFGSTFLVTLNNVVKGAFPSILNLRDFFQAAGAVQSPNQVYAWMPLLSIAQVALPAASFPQALVEIPLPDQQDYQIQLWRRELRNFTKAIHTRQRLMKEIPL